ncbi:MAG: 4Fe-4S binding protein [Fuerstiella sp.]
MAVTNLPIDIAEVADELEVGDTLLNVYDLRELKQVAPFDGMKPGPENFPGSMILRRCQKGRVLCRQGEKGATAFQILTPDDSIRVLGALLRGISKEESALNERILAIQTIVDGEPKKSTDAVETELEELQERLEFHRRGNSEREESLRRQIEQLERVVEVLQGEPVSSPREVVSARLLISNENARKGLLSRLVDRLRGRRSGRAGIPEYIPNDGPQDLDTNTLSAPMYEGDLFGEMSCMNLAPRSATVIVTEGQTDDPVYVVEMLRNALDALRSNAEFRRRQDQTYRTRVMENQVRSLPLFRVLTDHEYEWLADKLELVEFAAGDVIFDEHDSLAEYCYVVRTGVVKISQNLGCLLGDDELHDVPTLCRELVACGTGAEIAVRFWNELPAEFRVLINELAGPNSAPEQHQILTLRRGLNRWMQASQLHTTMGATTKELIMKSGVVQNVSQFEEFQVKTSDWWQIEVRIFNRVLLESFCPNGIRMRASMLNNQRTLTYASRGDLIGEMALLCGESRNATCLAFTHPLSGQKVATNASLIPQRVEAIRISADVLKELRSKSKEFKQLIDDLVESRRAENQVAVRPIAGAQAGSQTKEFDDLGLAWGQSLMVIDLDRCTRCNECVSACVDAHTDGRTRLYLDGPRFQGRHLIPVTCRQCLDPVCMIGCPVGAINRGSGGEIQISDHCIGCHKCADQCPYGSIQMDLLDSSPVLSPEQSDMFGPGYTLRAVQEKAVVCDLCTSTPGGQPSCVYACPHEAAIRVEGLQHFNS